MRYYSNPNAAAVRSIRLPGLSGLGEVGPSAQDIRAKIDLQAAKRYNRDSAIKNKWAVSAVAGGTTADSDDIAIETAFFQYAKGLPQDGKLGPQTLSLLKSFQETNYYAAANSNPRLAYGISLAQHIVIGTTDSKWALAASYNKEEARRGVFTVVGDYYSGAGDPRIAADVSLVQSKHNLPPDGRMTPDTVKLLRGLVIEGGREGGLISKSFSFPGVEPAPPPPPPPPPAPPPKKEEKKKEEKKDAPPRRDPPPKRKTPPKESNVGIVLGVAALAAGGYYLMQG